ncbi:tRNA methyltransferase 44 [Mortierella alpina]|uniref:tRNA (uracil-O(2)-)-methyltransferase n=1 Tax=Mortierella alpina TaxID=64518 RepID=A0A9P6LY37_MORAP|nr:tRNA methyltransferase 44 [Mortierella alpina]
MGADEPAAVEFVYDAAFTFDNLPNNQTPPQSDPQQQQQQPEQPQQQQPQKQPRWYRTACAPVPFSEDVFWQVLERWILEAPSVIPPISKVEIVQDTSLQAQETAAETPCQPHSPPSPYTPEREDLLLNGHKPFKSVRRRLVPKRAEKDPVMEEQLYYCRIQAPEEPDPTARTLEVADEESGPAASSYAVFAPIIVHSLTLEDNSQKERDEIQIMTETLPFYYPKVRGLRYGYRSDPEEAPEDHDDDHHDPSCHDAAVQGKPLGEEGEPFEHADLRDATMDQKKKKVRAKKVKVMSKRTGWITLDLFLAGDEGEFTSKMQYACKELFKKLYKWGVNTTKGFTKSRAQHDVLVPKELYLKTYARMKDKYAQKWVQSWPEKTDPRKFVFEDIAIAAWLVALWELERTNSGSTTATGSVTVSAAATEEGQGWALSERPTEPEKESMAVKKQTFVDLGCGNGLLTHILNEEGHQGTGIDIAARKVWDIYGDSTKLEAQTVIPNETVFENVDWVIGNHADELAPWIPIIASRSKPLTRFVVIPCCFFDLSGSRYQFPKGAPEGKYKAYQDYICSVINTCGYELEVEILRIPSTKNVALVGRSLKKRKREDVDDDEEEKKDVELSRRKKSVDELVLRSGLFVARISDRDKQILQKTKQEERQKN